MIRRGLRIRSACFVSAAAELVLLVLLSAPVAHAGGQIRVAVADDLSSVTVKATDGLVRDGDRQDGLKRIVLTSSGMGSAPVRLSSRGPFVQMNGRSFRGAIEIRKKRNGLLLAVNELDIEEYLKGVVAAEVPHGWELEALKAQAIASRTYALYRKRTAGSRPYHILATVDSQVYSGRSAEQASAIRAVEETAGIVITYRGEVIPAFYHSSCGGRTEDAWELWGIDAPYLRGVDCECQLISPYGEWEKRIDRRTLGSTLAKLGYRMTAVDAVAIDGITRAGRVKAVTVRHDRGTTSVPAEKLRAAVGYAELPSVFFEAGMDGSEVVLSGRGRGHGVGLCQWGAKEMAGRGLDYRAILAHYYPGTTLQKRGK